jgi:hypothetical protein
MGKGLNTEGWKIVQLIPAGEWCATHENEQTEWHDPLVAWALVEDAKGKRFVTGISHGGGGVVDTDFTESADNFVGYHHPKATGPAQPGFTVI